MKGVTERIVGAAVLAGLGAFLPLVMLGLVGAWLVSPRFVRGLFDQEGDGGHSTLDSWTKRG